MLFEYAPFFTLLRLCTFLVVAPLNGVTHRRHYGNRVLEMGKADDRSQLEVMDLSPYLHRSISPDLMSCCAAEHHVGCCPLYLRQW